MEVKGYTVGPVAENCYIFRKPDSDKAVIVDPGDEPDRLLEAIDELGVEIEAILLTHTHFDHVGAVAPVARATGAPVYCPELEAHVLRNVMSFVPPGFGPFESWEPEQTVVGGEKLNLGGYEIEVIHTPGHSPGHVTYWIPDAAAAFSGDVLFQSSIGRTDLPGGDYDVLMDTLSMMLEKLPDQTHILPGHMGATTIEQERKTNPFLLQLASS